MNNEGIRHFIILANSTLHMDQWYAASSKAALSNPLASFTENKYSTQPASTTINQLKTMYQGVTLLQA